MNQKYTNLFNHHFECLKQAYIDLNLSIVQDDSLTHIVQASVFYRYDYVLDFAFKTMQSYLTIHGDFEPDYKVIISKAMEARLIDNEEIWSQMLKDSNLKAQNYSDDEYLRVHTAIVGQYAQEIKALIQRL